jgi:hypothetical protein
MIAILVEPPIMNTVKALAVAAVLIAAWSAHADARQCRVEVSRRVDHWVGRHWTGSETYGRCVEWFPEPLAPEPPPPPIVREEHTPRGTVILRQ